MASTTAPRHLVRWLAILASIVALALGWLLLDRLLVNRRPIVVGLLHSQTGAMAVSERSMIDAELLAIYSDSELRVGVRGKAGWVLKKRTRTSWAYGPEVKEAITAIQQQAQHNGQAQPMITTYLAFTQGA
jgi:hypothetical protein